MLSHTGTTLNMKTTRNTHSTFTPLIVFLFHNAMMPFSHQHRCISTAFVRWFFVLWVRIVQVSVRCVCTLPFCREKHNSEAFSPLSQKALSLPSGLICSSHRPTSASLSIRWISPRKSKERQAGKFPILLIFWGSNMQQKFTKVHVYTSHRYKLSEGGGKWKPASRARKNIQERAKIHFNAVFLFGIFPLFSTARGNPPATEPGT